MNVTQHPRDVFELQGAEAAEEAWLAAAERGRLHHAWLLAGPEGVGKATFAYRAARRLLGARPAPELGRLGAAPDDPVSRLITARSHPDLLAIERGADDAKSKRVITVDEARRLSEFFAKSPSVAAWRVAIIDAADDLNPSAANAVLKTLEEPPERGVVLMVSHAPGRLLPTLRSRCRRLDFPPWSAEDIADFLMRIAGAERAHARRLAQLSGGAPGRALALMGTGALEMDAAAAALLAAPGRNGPEVQRLADKLRGGEGAERFALLLTLMADRIRTAALEAAGEAESERAERLSGAWERLTALPGEVEALNLDRADALWTAAAELRALRTA